MNGAIEFYEVGKQVPFLTIKSTFQPEDGDLVNIRKITYKVVGRSFTVDHADSYDQKVIRCNVILEKVK